MREEEYLPIGDFMVASTVKVGIPRMCDHQFIFTQVGIDSILKHIGLQDKYDAFIEAAMTLADMVYWEQFNCPKCGKQSPETLNVFASEVLKVGIKNGSYAVCWECREYWPVSDDPSAAWLHGDEDLCTWKANAKTLIAIQMGVREERDESFGRCPECGKGYNLMLNIGLEYYGCCTVDKTYWDIDSNLSSGWMKESRAAWESNANLINSYRKVEPLPAFNYKD